MPTAFLSPSIGLTNSDLENATASASDVLRGKTFYAGNSTIKTGTIPVMTHGEAKSISLWTNGSGAKFIQGNTIPVGYYKSNGEDYSPQINIPASLFGNAARTDVLSGKTFTSSNGAALSGSMTNRGAWTGTVNPGSSITIPKGYHNGSGKVTAKMGTGPIITPVNRTVGWGSGVLFNGYDTKSGSSNHMRVCLKYWCRTEYNVNGYICIMKNGKEVHATVFNKNYGSPYNDDNPNGFIDKTFSGSGTYSIQIKVDYQAGNGEIKFGGALIGY